MQTISVEMVGQEFDGTEDIMACWVTWAMRYDEAQEVTVFVYVVLIYDAHRVMYFMSNLRRYLALSFRWTARS